MSNVVFDLAQFSDIKNFLKFTTGGKTVPLTHIEVETDEVGTIFASTCLMKIPLPNDLPYLFDYKPISAISRDPKL